ncbi:helix-turn-helix transcriptional regulator [Streptomyces sp. ML-6]|uniref:helix-turn-helix domain-containing protein n=1 Tax=Streptomyces sp. ML-6 TaxID=2982693 RepID=UPI0024C0956D|nr:helix-turn-helix transcriptional regulator [Streptomyces sp. ML-6]MDK0524223.1 AraC family transcriptional regulator [Streptomyces sp. ML-6]
MPEFWHSALLPHLESRRSCQEITCYRPHTHDRFSIGLIDSGLTTFAGAAGEALPLAAGDVILIPAGHVHACNPENGRWRYQMIQADQDWITTLLPDEPGSLPTEISVFRHPGLHDRFSTINDLLFLGADAERAETEFRQVLHDCAELAPHHRIAPATDAALLARLGTVIDRLHEAEPAPGLDELAEVAGMDKYQLIRAMKRATGLPPLAWRQNDRIITARAMLRDGRSLAETAYALGFTDQSHFHRVFRAHVAATPGAYRR